MSVTVWGRATSSNVQAVMWGIAEMGLEATRIDLGGRHGGLDDPAFRAMNPVGLIPVARDGDGPAMFESAAILRALAARHGHPPFHPDDPDMRAQIDMWAEWAKHGLSAAFTVPVFWAFYRTPEAQRDMAAIAAATRRFEALLGLVAERLEGRDWLMGEALTLADIWAGHILFRYFTLEIERTPPAAIAAYFARLCDRAAYRTHVMIDYSELRAA
jgi:glutathione S-transferase